MRVEEECADLSLMIFVHDCSRVLLVSISSKVQFSIPKRAVEVLYPSLVIFEFIEVLNTDHRLTILCVVDCALLRALFKLVIQQRGTLVCGVAQFFVRYSGE